MANKANSVVTTQSVRVEQCICTAAKTTYNDAANAVLLFTAGANGSLLKSVKAIPRATVTATQLMLFLSNDGGTTLTLLPFNALMAAHTVAVTTAIPATDLGVSGLRLSPNDEIYAAIGVALAGGIAFTAEGEDFDEADEEV